MKVRSLYVVIFFLLVVQVVFAQELPENFNNFKTLTMDFSLHSGLEIQSTDPGWNVNNLRTDLLFYPKTTETQNVLEILYTSSPTARISSDEEKVNYLWESVTTNELDYGVQARVQTKTSIAQIDQSIDFPLQSVPSELLQDTQEKEFIDITPEIESQARALADGETDLYKVVHSIAVWTRNAVHYNLSTLTATAVQKSSWVFENKQGVCDEITNLFISLLRSLGIPAKFVSGMVYSNLNNEWGPHGWAEVYFPGYGWVPYDVTFGQFGWLDPSHIKLMENVDSGAPSAEYSWTAFEADVTAKESSITTTLVNTGSPQEDLIQLAVEPERSTVGPGSHIPIIVTITNLQQHYITPQVIVTKAPKLLSSNVREVALGPKETKKVVWIAEIQSDMKEGYVYTSSIEVNADFAPQATSQVQYGVDYDIYQPNEAAAFAASLEAQEKKEHIRDMTISCVPDKQAYYVDDLAKIYCSLMNKGNKKLSGEFCLAQKCERITVAPQKKENVVIEMSAKETGRLTAVFESEEQIAYQLFEMTTINIPRLTIKNVEPTQAEYGETVALALTLMTTAPVHDLTIDFGFGQITIDRITKESPLQMSVPARALVNGINAKAVYKDELEKTYTEEFTQPFTILNIPWYVKLWLKVLSWF